ncbi:hypothetical protein PENSPDRAFT_651161 [Peniophora sp. CONT]|nr:hypothetical protein PENSPDRAFT_651161 [Peniophora sp. CONT]
MPQNVDNIEVSQDAIDNLRVNSFLTLLLAALYCFLASAAFIAVYTLLKDGIRSLSGKLNMAAVTVMFGLTTAYTIVQVLQLWSSFDKLDVNTQSMDSFDANLYNISPRLESTVFAVNIVLGDAIILWRAAVIWKWQKRVVYPSVFILSATIVLWALVNIYGKSAIAVPGSLATSLWATVIVSIKAWQRRRMLKKKVAIMSRHNALENIFNILTESGIVFTLLWVISVYASETPYNAVFAETMTVIMIVATPLYPTMIVILVAQHKTPISNQLTAIEPETIMDAESQDLLHKELDMGKENVRLEDLQR